MCTTSGNTPELKDQEIILESFIELQREHEKIGNAVAVYNIRYLSHEYAIPNDVCNTFMVTYQKLKEFEEDLHTHARLENNSLFPKAALL